MFLCVLMSVYQFTSYVVTAVCQLLLNGYVMLCHVITSRGHHHTQATVFMSFHQFLLSCFSVIVQTKTHRDGQE